MIDHGWKAALMHDRELDAYLGDFKEQLIELRGLEGYEDLRRTLDAIRERYPDEDSVDARTNAGNAAAMLAYGDITLSEMAATWQEARMTERAAMESLTGAILWEAVRGTPQARIVDATGAARATVAKAMGR